MIKTVQNYLIGILIFLLYPCGLVVVTFILIKEVTNSLSRNMTGNDILLALIILLATTILLPLGTLRIVKKLRENGKEQWVHGMFMGLVLLVLFSLVNGEIQERKEQQSEVENEASIKKDNEARTQYEKEVEQTRKELQKEAEQTNAE